MFPVRRSLARRKGENVRPFTGDIQREGKEKRE